MDASSNTNLNKETKNICEENKELRSTKKF